jgi:hypothetical protein
MDNPVLETKRLDTEKKCMHVPTINGDFFKNLTKIRLEHFLVTIHVDRAITRNPHLL